MSAQEYNHQLSLEAFQQAFRQARKARLWHRITRKPYQTLLPFEPIQRQLDHQNGVEQRVRAIPLAQIVGSLSRWKEFDRDFRPLSDKLRNRWTAMADLTQADGWPPIRVHQVGNLYFVEDGHHRVSVARQFGFTDIEAIVIKHSVLVSFTPQDSLNTILQKIALWQKKPMSELCCALKPSSSHWTECGLVC